MNLENKIPCADLERDEEPKRTRDEEESSFADDIASQLPLKKPPSDEGIGPTN